jgi:2-methylisocitrate lyase-like PEP mutase family enzyme
MSRHQAFADLHQAGCFVMPNPWDRGSAKLMAAKGAVALATTSAGHAFYPRQARYGPCNPR